MTYLEKVLSENPQMKPCEVMEEKCPSDFGYEDSRGADCNFSLEFDCCIKCWNREMPEVVDVSMLAEKYNEGLNDAWELVKKLYEMKFVELEKAFDGHEHLEDIFDNFTPQEALAKLKAYEEAQKIEVGDVIVHHAVGNHPVLVTKVLDNNYFEGINEFGLVYSYRKGDEWKKTGKHIDIKSILEQIGE